MTLQGTARRLAFEVGGGLRLCDRVIEALIDAGASRMFGMGGDSINSLLDAARRSDGMRYVGVRHETNGVAMAIATARLSGAIGVALGTNGPGATHVVSGFREARRQRVPVLCITGTTPEDLLGTRSFQETDIASLLGADALSVTVRTPQDLDRLHRSLRVALERSEPVHAAITPEMLVSDATLPTFAGCSPWVPSAAPLRTLEATDRPVDRVLDVLASRGTAATDVVAVDGRLTPAWPASRTTGPVPTLLAGSAELPGFAVPAAIAAVLHGASAVAVTTAADLCHSGFELLTAMQHGAMPSVVSVPGDGAERQPTHSEAERLAALSGMRFSRLDVADLEGAAGRSTLLEALERDAPCIVEISDASPRPSRTGRALRGGERRAAADRVAAIVTTDRALESLGEHDVDPDDALVFPTVESASMAASGIAKCSSEPVVLWIARAEELDLALNGLLDASYDGAKVLVVVAERGPGEALGADCVSLVTGFGHLVAWTSTPIATLRSRSDAQDRSSSRVFVTVRDLGVDAGHREDSPCDGRSDGAAVGDVGDAADRLRRAGSVCVVVGRGARSAGAEIREVAELLGAPVLTTMGGVNQATDLGSAFCGRVGGSGHFAANTTLRRADLVLRVGCSARSRVFGDDPRKSTIDVDRDPALSLNGSDRTHLVGDAAAVLRALADELRSRPRRDPGATASFLLRSRRRFEREVRWLQRGTQPGPSRLAPSEVARLLDGELARLDEPAVVTVDVGLVTLWAYRFLLNGDLHFSASFGTMGFAVPAAVGIRVADRSRPGPVVALVGDGGFATTAAGIQAAPDDGPPLVVVVANNGKLGAIKYEMESMGWPEHGTGLHRGSIAQYARAAGLRGFEATTEEELVRALRSALAAPGTSVIDARCTADDVAAPAVLRLDMGLGYFVGLARELGGGRDGRAAARRGVAATVRYLAGRSPLRAGRAR